MTKGVDVPNKAPTFKDVNDVVYAVAEKAKVLANNTLPSLRYAAAVNAKTWAGAQLECAYKSRGELVEEILLEEFLEEFPRGIEES